MISAIILAAGQSKRMGQPKMLLPWGKVTVIEHVISVFAEAGIEDILVVTGAACESVEKIVQDCKSRFSVRSVFNEDYLHGEMLSSIQCGLRALSQREVTEAVMIGLGDQPQIQEGSVRKVAEAFVKTASPIVVPSYQMRRGHPWLAARSVWNELLEMKQNQSPRDFLNSHIQDIHYVDVDTPSILADLDTPEDYKVSHP